MYSFSYLEPVCCSMSSSNCCFLTCMQISQEAGQVVWYSHLFQNFPQFVVIHTVKGFGLVNKAEIDVFLELSCFFYDPSDALHEIKKMLGIKAMTILDSILKSRDIILLTKIHIVKAIVLPVIMYNVISSVVSDSLRLHGLQPTRLLHPWDFPGKSTGAGCHCLLRGCVNSSLWIIR